MQKIKDILNHPVRIKSIIVLFIIFTLSSFSNIEKTGLIVAILGFLFSLIYGPILIYLIVCIRGTEKKFKANNTHITGELGVWGFTWRTLIIGFLSATISTLTFKVLFGVWSSPQNIPLYISVSTLMVFFMPIITWLIFSPDRKGQFVLALRRVRGY